MTNANHSAVRSPQIATELATELIMGRRTMIDGLSKCDESPTRSRKRHGAGAALLRSFSRSWATPYCL